LAFIAQIIDADDEESNDVMCADNGRTNHRHRYQLRRFAAEISPRETIGKHHY